MKLYILFIFSFLVKDSFAFGYKITDKKDIEKFIELNGRKTFRPYINALSWGRGYSSILIQKIECSQKNIQCPKEVKDAWGNPGIKECTVSQHKVTYKAKGLKGGIKNGSINFKEITNKDGDGERCKWYYDEVKKRRKSSFHNL